MVQPMTQQNFFNGFPKSLLYITVSQFKNCHRILKSTGQNILLKYTHNCSNIIIFINYNTLQKGIIF